MTSNNRMILKKQTLLLVVILLLIACESPQPEPTPEPEIIESIEFESLTFSGHLWTPFMPLPEEGRSTTVGGILSIPESSGQIPAMVITHGCGGITSAETGWARQLNEFGLATLIVQSFGARRITGICRGEGEVNIATVLADAYAALEYLESYPRIDPKRIGILGLSFGGRTAIWASSERFQARYNNSENQFAAYIGFYPASCYLQLADEEKVSGGPIRIFHGMADDWIPIAPCQEYIERMQQAGIDADIFAYPDATHSFDNPTNDPPVQLFSVLSPGNCAFVERDGQIIDPDTGKEPGIDSPCVIRGGSLGYNEEAYQKSIEDMQTFLEDVFQTE